MEKYIQIGSLKEVKDGETVCASYPNPIKNVSGLKQDPQMLAAEQDAICGKCKLLVWRKVSDKTNSMTANSIWWKNDEYIKKSDVIAMLKEMQVNAAKCNGFIAGMVAQIWVVRDLLGKSIEKLGGTPYIVKDGKLEDADPETEQKSKMEAGPKDSKMVSRELLEAASKYTDMLENPIEKVIGEYIFLMLSEFSDENWHDLKDSGATEEWLRQYLPKK